MCRQESTCFPDGFDAVLRTLLRASPERRPEGPDMKPFMNRSGYAAAGALRFCHSNWMIMST